MRCPICGGLFCPPNCANYIQHDQTAIGPLVFENWYQDPEHAANPPSLQIEVNPWDPLYTFNPHALSTPVLPTMQLQETIPHPLQETIPHPATLPKKSRARQREEQRQTRHHNSEQQQSNNVPEVITVLSSSEEEEEEERDSKRARQNSQQRRPPQLRARQMDQQQSIEVVTILSSSEEEEEEEEERGSNRAATSSSIGEAEELGQRHSVGGGERSEPLEVVELSSGSDDGEDSDVVPVNVSTDDDEEAADPGEGPGGGGGGGGAAAAASFAGPTSAYGVKQKQREAHRKNVAMLDRYTVLSRRTSRPGPQLPKIENAITKTVTSMIKSFSTMLDIILMKAPGALPRFLTALFGVGTAAELTSGQAFSRGYGKSTSSEAYIIDELTKVYMALCYPDVPYASLNGVVDGTEGGRQRAVTYAKIYRIIKGFDRRSWPAAMAMDGQLSKLGAQNKNESSKLCINVELGNSTMQQMEVKIQEATGNRHLADAIDAQVYYLVANDLKEKPAGIFSYRGIMASPSVKGIAGTGKRFVLLWINFDDFQTRHSDVVICEAAFSYKSAHGKLQRNPFGAKATRE